MYKSFLNTRVTFNMRSVLICCKYILLLFHLLSFHYLLLTKYTLSFFYTKAHSVPRFHQKTQPKRGEMEIVFFRQWRRAGANTLLEKHSSRWSLIQQICKGSRLYGPVTFPDNTQHARRGAERSCEVRGLAGAGEAEGWQRISGNSREYVLEMT